MASRNPFRRIRLVYRRSSLFLKILVLVTLVFSIAALVALRGIVSSYEQQKQALHAQAIVLQQENRELTERIAELGTKASIRRIATEELGLISPGSHFFKPGE